MATVRLGSIVADIRGKVGDEIYSRNKGGIYVRSRPDWIQPDTQDQLDARAVLIALAPAWSATLNDAKRATWRSYARQNLVPDKWGTPHPISGHCWFLRINSHFYRATESLGYQWGPTGPPLKSPTFDMTADATTDNIHLDLASLNYHPPSVGLQLFAYVSKSRPAGVNYYNAPWRYAGTQVSNVPPWVNIDFEYPAQGHFTYLDQFNEHARYQHDQEAWWLSYWDGTWYLNENPDAPEEGDYFTGPLDTVYGDYAHAGEPGGNAHCTETHWLYDPWDLTPITAPAEGDHLWTYLHVQDTCTGQLSTRGRSQCTATA